MEEFSADPVVEADAASDVLDVGTDLRRFPATLVSSCRAPVESRAVRRPLPGYTRR